MLSRAVEVVGCDASHQQNTLAAGLPCPRWETDGIEGSRTSDVCDLASLHRAVSAEARSGCGLSSTTRSLSFASVGCTCQTSISVEPDSAGASHCSNVPSFILNSAPSQRLLIRMPRLEILSSLPRSVDRACAWLRSSRVLPVHLIFRLQWGAAVKFRVLTVSNSMGCVARRLAALYRWRSWRGLAVMCAL